MFIVFLLLIWFINSYRLHTPYAQSHSPEHPPASSLHNLPTDQWECPVNKTAFVRLLCRASRLLLCYSTLSEGHQQADFQVCKQQNTTHPNPPPKQIYRAITILISATISKLHTHTLRMQLHPQWKGITTAHPPCSLPVAQGITLPIQGQEGRQLKPGRLIPVSELFLHMLA